MSSNQATQPDYSNAAYVVSADNHVMRNDMARSLEEHADEIRRQIRRLDASYLGAFFGRLFRQNPWLDSITLSFQPSMENDDAGGYFTVVNGRVDEVANVVGVEAPEDVRDDSGAFDSDLACNFLSREVEDNDTGLYEGLVDDIGELSDVTITARRAPLADLLAQPEINGNAVFERLFPDRAEAIR